MQSLFIRKLRAFSHDENGMEMLQVVMILAIAAVCLITVKAWSNWYAAYVKQAFDILVED